MSGNYVDPGAWKRHRDRLRDERQALLAEQAELEPIRDAFEDQLGRLRDRYIIQLSRTVNASNDVQDAAPPTKRGGKGRAA
jgi:hypothetical protein